jgi:hypothetical protein
VLPREGAEAVARAVVRREGLLIGVTRVGGDLLRNCSHLLLDRGTVRGVAEQGVDPALGAVPVGDVVVEEELAEHDAGADIGERPEGQDAMRRLDACRERRIVPHDAVDDAADGLVDQRNPELVEVGHDRIMPLGEVP